MSYAPGLPLINVLGEDLIEPRSVAYSIESLDVVDLAGRTMILGVPSLSVTGQG